jgi:hypothetical protein
LTFSHKFIDVQPLKTKQPEDVLKALKDGMHNMGGICETLYSDDEGSLNSKLLENYFKEHNILHIVTRSSCSICRTWCLYC